MRLSTVPNTRSDRILRTTSPAPLWCRAFSIQCSVKRPHPNKIPSFWTVQRLPLLSKPAFATDSGMPELVQDCEISALKMRGRMPRLRLTEMLFVQSRATSCRSAPQALFIRVRRTCMFHIPYRAGYVPHVAHVIRRFRSRKGGRNNWTMDAICAKIKCPFTEGGSVATTCGPSWAATPEALGPVYGGKD